MCVVVCLFLLRLCIVSIMCVLWVVSVVVVLNLSLVLVFVMMVVWLVWLGMLVVVYLVMRVFCYVLIKWGECFVQLNYMECLFCFVKVFGGMIWFLLIGGCVLMWFVIGYVYWRLFIKFLWLMVYWCLLMRLFGVLELVQVWYIGIF